MGLDKTIFVIEDNQSTNDNLKDLLRILNYPVMTFTSSEDFLEQYHGEQGVLLLDVRLPGESGIQLFRRIQKNYNHRKSLTTIFLSGHGDIEMAVECMKQGACDFVTKPFKNQDLLDKIHHALNSKEPDHIDSSNFSQYLDQHYPELSPREKEVLGELKKGLNSKEIAKKLTISVHTVEVHRANLMRKTNSKSIAQLLAKLHK